MKKTHLLCSMCALFSVFVTTTACAITVLSNGSILEAAGNGVTRTERDFTCCVLHELGAPNASASLLHRIFSVSGEASVNITNTYLTGEASAFSGYSISFEIDNPYRYELLGTLTGDGASIDFIQPFDTAGIVNATGILQPGQYTLSARASAEGFGLGYSETSAYDVTLNLTMVPIPATLFLFGSGMLGLIEIARKKAA